MSDVMSDERVPHFTRWPVVEGYCAQQSYFAGEEVSVHCASRSASFSVEVARIGVGREIVWSSEALRVDDYPVPDRAWENGCGWPVGFVVPTDPSWLSGYYEIRMIDDDSFGPQSTAEAFFVLKDPPGSRNSDALILLSTNTYNAYNQWGGSCLYSGATKVSFLRPLERGYLRRPAAPMEVAFDGRVANVADPSDPTHSQLLEYQALNNYPLWCNSAGWHNWERRFVRWAEAAGYVLSYGVNQDLHCSPDLVSDYPLLLTIGHDEYWSWEMRDNAERFVADGGNWIILSGDTCTWQVRYQDDGSSIVCFKDVSHETDPVLSTGDVSRLTTMWSDPIVGRPETTTIGLTFTRGGYHRIGGAIPNGDGAYEIHRPRHWAFQGLDLMKGDRIGGSSFAVAYEVNGCALSSEGNVPRPTYEDGAPESLEILATAPARLISISDTTCEAPAGLWASLDPPGDLEEVALMLYGDDSLASTERIAENHAVMGTFSLGKGTVFNGGSADWAYGLDGDEEVQTITSNVMDHLKASD